MNSLEWVNAEIIKWQEILNDFKKQLIEVKGLRNEQTTLNHIEFYKLKLKYLHKIKEELEAWEIAKEHKVDLFHIEVLDTAEEFNYDLVSQYQLTEEDFNKLKKALEVEDER